MYFIVNFYKRSLLLVVGVILIGNYLSVNSTVIDETTPCGFRNGEIYILCKHHIDDFKTKGLAILYDIISEEEISTIEGTYNEYMANGSPTIQGKDFCDMSKPFDTPREEYSVINAMLPVSEE